MGQYQENQYDDDLTIGEEDYSESFQTSEVDLFEFGGEEESPIDRLKTLVLSIDWEITDDILLQFNEEIVDLKDIWAGEQINQVYLQALEKISKYIYRDKADAHPNAIKLLLSLYYNLEKIVSSDDLTEDEKKQILLGDIKKFECLKRQISKKKPNIAPEHELVPPGAPAVASAEPVDSAGELMGLKAIVLGIDWEITEKDLLALRTEVVRLEEKFAGSRAKLIFLQGIGTLGAYIRHKKSNAHADAFTLLHSFYEGLETIVKTPMSLAEEKAILFPEVDKFNAFKALIGPTISPDALREKVEDEQADEYADEQGIVPAFADLPEDQTRGFQEEEEAAALGFESAANVDSRIESFFGEEPETEAVSLEAGPAEDETAARPDISALHVAETLSDEFFGIAEEVGTEGLKVDKEIALQGVEVETEADDDSGEEALPFDAGELAPALTETAQMSTYSEESLGRKPSGEEVSGEVLGRLDEFFAEEAEVAAIKEAATAAEVAPAFGVPADVALQGVAVEAEGDEEEPEEMAEMFVPGAAVAEEMAVTTEEVMPAFADVGVEALEEEPAAAAELHFEEELEPFFTEEPAPAFAEDVEPAAEERAEPEELVDVAEHLDSFFALDEAEAEEEPEVSAEEVMPAFADVEVEEWEEEPVAAAELHIEEELETFVGEEPAPAFAEDVEQVGEDFSRAEESVDVAEQLDSFFALDEEKEPVEEVPAFEEHLEFEGEDVTASVVDEAAVEVEESELLTTLPESAAAPLAAAVEVEEEVVFEPVEEEEEEGLFEALGEEIVAATPAEEVSEEPALEEFFEVQTEAPEAEPAAVSEDLEEPVVAGQAAMDEVEAASVEDEAARYTAVFEAAEEEIAEEEIFVVPEEADLLSNLQACVSSLGLELEDSIFQGLFAEINSLRQRWVSRPVEKSYLQLLSTIAQHIDQYRYEASAEAYGLLVTVFENMAKTQSVDIAKAQEMLLTVTYKVLQWQQNMLNRQAVRRGSQLTFLDPIRSGEKKEVSTGAERSLPEDGFEDEFTAVFEAAPEEEGEETVSPADFEQEVIEGQLDFEDALAEVHDYEIASEDDLDMELEEALKLEVEQAEKSLAAPAAGDDHLTEIIRRELESLRRTLQEELAELRQDITKSSGKEE